MIRTFRYPLRPTAAQAETLESWRIACQQLYNGALQERRDAWKRAKVSVTKYNQYMGLTELRQTDAEWRAMPSQIQRAAIDRLDRSFQSFFRRVRAGKKPGYPRFKSRDRYGSIGLGGGYRINGHFIHIAKMGPVRFHQYRPLKGTPFSAELRRIGERWFLTIKCDIGEAPSKSPVSTSVGIDFGLKSLVTLSSGEEVGAPKFAKKSEERLGLKQQTASRKKAGSRAHRRARLQIGKVHCHIKNQRLDFARKLAKRLVMSYDLIAYEGLAISQLVQGVMAKSILDAAWGILIRCLVCKAEEAGKHLVAVEPRGTTVRCSGCGTSVPKRLSERMHRCTACGLVIGRDHNAAVNILALGLQHMPTARGIALAHGEKPL